MKENWLSEELSRIAFMESRYEWIADLVKPGELEENLGSSARDYMAALRGLERCMELRLKLIREYGRLPSEEGGEPLATVDLSRLSDDALEEVEAALVPVAAASPEEGVEEGVEEASAETSPVVRVSGVSPSAEPGEERSRGARKSSEERKDESCKKRSSAQRVGVVAESRAGRRRKAPSSG